MLAGWLADDRALVAGLHAYAQMEVPLDDAVEAEAIAQLLDAEAKEQMLDSVVRVYAIKDLDALVANLAATGACNPSKSIRRSSKAAISRGRGTRTCCSISRCPRSGVGIQRGEVPSLAGRDFDLRSANESPRAARAHDRPRPEFRSHASPRSWKPAATRSAK